MRVQKVYCRLKLRANIGVLAQDPGETEPVEHRGRGFAGTAHVDIFLGAVTFEVSIKIVCVPIRIIQVRLKAKSQRIAKRQIILLGSDQSGLRNAYVSGNPGGCERGWCIDCMRGCESGWGEQRKQREGQSDWRKNSQEA